MKPLVIQAPMTGIAQSPHIGFGLVKNLDIYSTPGVARLNYKVAKTSVTTVDAFVKWIVRDPDTPANIFALDSNGVLYKSANTGLTWSEVSDRGGSGQGLMVKWGYVFVCEDTTIDVMKISDSSWTNNWQTIDTDSLWHPMLTSVNDNKIYGGAGRYIFSIEENSGQTFAPGTAATYSWTARALDLPANYRIKCLAELGNNLMIGTWQGTNIYDFKIATIFPWNRSYPSFEQPIVLNENGVNAMININNNLYVLPGLEGKVYKSDGYNATPIGQIPSYVADINGGKYLEPSPGSIINFKGRLFFGLSGSGAIGGQGIYSLMETSGGNILNLEHIISTGEDGSNDVVKIGGMISLTRDSLNYGWQDDENSSYGIDKLSTTQFPTGYIGCLDSPLYALSSFSNKHKFSNLELNLTRPLRANEGVKIQYRQDLSESWTDIITFDYDSYGGERGKYIETQEPYLIKAGEYIQIRVLLTGSATTPEFKKLSLS